MAEIKVTEKKGSWVPWLIGIVAVGALIWFVAVRNAPVSNTAERPGAYDSNSAAGTLDASRDSAMRDSMMMRNDSLRVPPPR